MGYTSINTIVQIKFGSHLYGTNTPISDEDYKSVYIPYATDILLQRVSDSIQLGKKNKQHGEKNLPGDIDNECYSLQKYLKLISEGQTVAIDMLFAPEKSIIKCSSLWTYIQSNKDKLLTKKSIAFVGYCRTQANKYGIKGSRVSSAKNALRMFESLLAIHGNTAKVGEFFPAEDMNIDEHTRILQKETTKGKTERYFECCNRMVGFNNNLKEAVNIYKRIYDNYGERARLAQANEGIDWKALSHAVRVGREAIELLQTNNITFPLPYASHILDIKQGKLSYDVVSNEIEQLLEDIEKESLVSELPEEPDYKFIDGLVCETYGNAIYPGFSYSY